MSEAIKKAEEDVKRSISEFDRAVNHLEQALADGGQKLTYVVDVAKDTAQMPKRFYRRVSARARDYAVVGRDTSQRYALATRDRAVQSYGQAKENLRQPKVFLPLLGFVGSVIAFALFRRMRRSSLERIELEETRPSLPVERHEGLDIVVDEELRKAA